MPRDLRLEFPSALFTHDGYRNNPVFRLKKATPALLPLLFFQQLSAADLEFVPPFTDNPTAAAWIRSRPARADAPRISRERLCCRLEWMPVS
jgi:hypothetical protein